MQVLEAQAHTVVPPSDRSGLHPLLIPLAEGATGPAPASSSDRQQQQPHAVQQAPQGDGRAVVCLLRAVGDGAGAMPLPVVRMARGGTSMALLARSIDEYLARVLAEEDARGAGPGGPLAAATGPEGAQLYAPGTFAASGLPTLEAFLTRKVAGWPGVGIFPDVAEGLALAHLAKGDDMSGLITAEWYMRSTHLPGWGRPYEFACEVMRRVGRAEEARDVARLALRLPWATFAGGHALLASAAGMPGGTAAVRQALADAEEMSTMPSGALLQPSALRTWLGAGGDVVGRPRGARALSLCLRTTAKTTEEAALDDALWLLNAGAAGERGWDELRGELAAALAAAGRREATASKQEAQGAQQGAKGTHPEQGALSALLAADPTLMPPPAPAPLLPAKCLNCGTPRAETPTMRAGPRGPSTLCNACGLIWKKTGQLRDIRTLKNCGRGAKRRREQLARQAAQQEAAHREVAEMDAAAATAGGDGGKAAPATPPPRRAAAPDGRTAAPRGAAALGPPRKRFAAVRQPGPATEAPAARPDSPSTPDLAAASAFAAAAMAPPGPGPWGPLPGLPSLALGTYKGCCSPFVAPEKHAPALQSPQPAAAPAAAAPGSAPATPAALAAVGMDLPPGTAAVLSPGWGGLDLQSALLRQAGAVVMIRPQSQQQLQLLLAGLAPITSLGLSLQQGGAAPTPAPAPAPAPAPLSGRPLPDGWRAAPPAVPCVPDLPSHLAAPGAAPVPLFFPSPAPLPYPACADGPCAGLASSRGSPGSSEDALTLALAHAAATAAPPLPALRAQALSLAEPELICMPPLELAPLPSLDSPLSCEQLEQLCPGAAAMEVGSPSPPASPRACGGGGGTARKLSRVSTGGGSTSSDDAGDAALQALLGDLTADLCFA
eukprot:scaffold10.g2465.t1